MPKNAQTTAQLHSSHTLKILQARLQQYVNRELPDVQAVLEKAEEPEIKLPTPTGSSKKQENSKKNLLLLHWLHQSLWLCGSQQTVENSSRDWNTDHLTCLLRNLYAGQEAIVRTVHRTTDCFQIGKGVCQGYILSPCLFNLYSEYIIWNAGLDEAQAGIKMLREISVTSDIQVPPPLWQRVKRNWRASCWR